MGLRKYPKEGTIGRVVLDALAKDPQITTEDLLPIVLKDHPESKFGKTHLSWYKHQVKKGNYILPKGMKILISKARPQVAKQQDVKQPKLKGKAARAAQKNRQFQAKK